MSFFNKNGIRPHFLLLELILSSIPHTWQEAHQELFNQRIASIQLRIHVLILINILPSHPIPNDHKYTLRDAAMDWNSF
jgi:hypothetical protein